MNIPLTPDELKKLIELAHLGEWVLNSQHDHEYQDEAASAVMQALLAASKLPEVEQDIETKNYYMLPEWSDRLFDHHIVDYDDHVFWSELTERMAQRDLARRRGVSPEEIIRDEDVRALRPLEERYRREFEERGIENLELSDGF